MDQGMSQLPSANLTNNSANFDQMYDRQSDGDAQPAKNSARNDRLAAPPESGIRKSGPNGHQEQFNLKHSVENASSMQAKSSIMNEGGRNQI